MKTEPVASTLNSVELQRHASNLLPGLFIMEQDVDWMRTGVRLTFADETILLPRIADVIERERKCFRFFRFRMDLAPGLGAIVLEITGPPGTRDVLEALHGIDLESQSWSAYSNRRVVVAIPESQGTE